jgi:hypothetical protein
MPASVIKSLVILALVSAAHGANAYGNRNWLSANQYYSDNVSDNTYSWGYNYRMLGRHTTVRDEDDVTGWMYNGNVRNGGSRGSFHWDKLRRR